MGKDLNGKELGHGIIQKRNGRYEARYVDRFGKRRSISGNDLRKVKRDYNEALYENDKEINIREKITLDQWYDKWMLLYKIGTIKESSRVRYRDTYKKHISPVLGRYYLSEIQQYQIKELIKNMKDNDLGYEMQNQTKILLVDMFDKAMVNEFVRKNPAKGISVKRDEKKEPRVLSVEEQYDFFECSKGTFYDNFFDVAVTTGMRLGEIAALTWNDIDLERRIISVTKTLVYIKYEGDLGKTFHMETPKTRTSVREIPINKQCELALKKQYAQKKVIESKAPVSKKPKEEFQNLLFTTKFNTPLNSQIIIDAIHKIVLTINETRYYIEEMEDFSCHCFRHTFATRCFEAGIQPKTVQKYLGHATLQMTMDLYTAVMPKHLSSEMEKLDDELEKISQSGEKLIDSRYKKEKQNDVITFPGNTLVV